MSIAIGNRVEYALPEKSLAELAKWTNFRWSAKTLKPLVNRPVCVTVWSGDRSYATQIYGTLKSFDGSVEGVDLTFDPVTSTRKFKNGAWKREKKQNNVFASQRDTLEVLDGSDVPPEAL